MTTKPYATSGDGRIDGDEIHELVMGAGRREDGGMSATIYGKTDAQEVLFAIGVLVGHAFAQMLLTDSANSDLLPSAWANIHAAAQTHLDAIMSGGQSFNKLDLP